MEHLIYIYTIPPRPNKDFVWLANQQIFHDQLSSYDLTPPDSTLSFLTNFLAQ